jgi:sucrose phosphorylase
VPDRENLSYFGENNDEAHMIYQFPLPPLLLHALHSGSSRHLTGWAQSIPEPGSEATYFNFTASHDGIGLRPAEGLIPKQEVSNMVDRMQDFGGHVSTRTNPDGSESPYEINITWFDALKGTHEGPDNLQTERFLCSQTIMMSLRGIPGFYIHSLFATENDREGVERTGKYRSINRKTRDLQELTDRLNDDGHPAHQIFQELKRLMAIRTDQPAFHPDSIQEIIDMGAPFFAIKRTHESGEQLWSVSNITPRRQQVDLKGLNTPSELHDLISGNNLQAGTTTLDPYQTLWLKKPSEKPST